MAGSAYNINIVLQAQGINNLSNVINNIKGQLSQLKTDIRVNLPNLKGIKDAANTLGSLNNSSSSLANVSKGLQDTNKELRVFGENAGIATRRFLAFSLATGTIFGVLNALKNGISNAIEFERQMIRVAQVSSSATDITAELAQEITALSTSLGVSSAELAKSAVTFQQAGFNVQELAEALKTVSLADLSPTFDSIEKTGEAIVAAKSQFKLAATDFVGAFGSINAVAAQFAVESADITEAIKKAGGAFAVSAGQLTSSKEAFNQFISLFTSVRATTRESAAEIATGLRTIFTRIQRGSTGEALRQLGINLRFTQKEAEALGRVDLTGQFVGAFEAVNRLSQAFNSISSGDPRFSAIVEELGGVRQVSRVIPLIQQFSTAQQALVIAQSGQLSLSIAQEKAQDSLAVKLNKVREQYESLARTFTNSTGFQVATQSFLTLANALSGLLELIGPSISGIALLFATRAIRGTTSFFGGFSDRFTGQPSKLKFNRGGIVPGTGDTDSVNADLTPGEFVIRKSSAKAIGYDKLNQLNAKGRQGFANGGDIEDRTFSALARLQKKFPSIPFNKARTGFTFNPTNDIALFNRRNGLINIRPDINDEDLLEQAIFHESIHGFDRYESLIRNLNVPFFSERKVDNPLSGFISNAQNIFKSLPLLSPENKKYLLNPPESLAHFSDFFSGLSITDSGLLIQAGINTGKIDKSRISLGQKGFENQVIPFLESFKSTKGIREFLNPNPKKLAEGGLTKDYLNLAVKQLSDRFGFDFSKNFTDINIAKIDNEKVGGAFFNKTGKIFLNKNSDKSKIVGSIFHETIHGADLRAGLSLGLDNFISKSDKNPFASFIDTGKQLIISSDIASGKILDRKYIDYLLQPQETLASIAELVNFPELFEKENTLQGAISRKRSNLPIFSELEKIFEKKVLPKLKKIDKVQPLNDLLAKRNKLNRGGRLTQSDLFDATGNISKAFGRDFSRLFNNLDVDESLTDLNIDALANSKEILFNPNRDRGIVERVLFHEISHLLEDINDPGINELKSFSAKQFQDFDKAGLFSGINPELRDYFLDPSESFAFTSEFFSGFSDDKGYESQILNEAVKRGLVSSSELLAQQKKFQLGIGRAKFANGGINPKDTIPALLTPGEFVLRQEAASSLGLPALDYMNRTGKIPKGFNKGGYVKRADGSTTPERFVPSPSNIRFDAESENFADLISKFASSFKLQGAALKEFVASLDGARVGIDKFTREIIGVFSNKADKPIVEKPKEVVTQAASSAQELVNKRTLAPTQKELAELTEKTKPVGLERKKIDPKTFNTLINPETSSRLAEIIKVFPEIIALTEDKARRVANKRGLDPEDVISSSGEDLFQVVNNLVNSGKTNDEIIAILQQKKSNPLTAKIGNSAEAIKLTQSQEKVRNNTEGTNIVEAASFDPDSENPNVLSGPFFEFIAKDILSLQGRRTNNNKVFDAQAFLAELKAKVANQDSREGLTGGRAKQIGIGQGVESSGIFNSGLAAQLASIKGVYPKGNNVKPEDIGRALLAQYEKEFQAFIQSNPQSLTPEQMAVIENSQEYQELVARQGGGKPPIKPPAPPSAPGSSDDDKKKKKTKAELAQEKFELLNRQLGTNIVAGQVRGPFIEKTTELPQLIYSESSNDDNKKSKEELAKESLQLLQKQLGTGIVAGQLSGIIGQPIEPLNLPEFIPQQAGVPTYGIPQIPQISDGFSPKPLTAKEFLDIYGGKNPPGPPSSFSKLTGFIQSGRLEDFANTLNLDQSSIKAEIEKFLSGLEQSVAEQFRADFNSGVIGANIKDGKFSGFSPSLIERDEQKVANQPSSPIVYSNLNNKNSGQISNTVLNTNIRRVEREKIQSQIDAFLSSLDKDIAQGLRLDFKAGAINANIKNGKFLGFSSPKPLEPIFNPETGEITEYQDLRPSNYLGFNNRPEPNNPTIIEPQDFNLNELAQQSTKQIIGDKTVSNTTRQEILQQEELRILGELVEKEKALIRAIEKRTRGIELSDEEATRLAIERLNIQETQNGIVANAVQNPLTGALGSAKSLDEASLAGINAAQAQSGVGQPGFLRRNFNNARGFLTNNRATRAFGSANRLADRFSGVGNSFVFAAPILGEQLFGQTQGPDEAIGSASSERSFARSAGLNSSIQGGIAFGLIGSLFGGFGAVIGFGIGALKSFISGTKDAEQQIRQAKIGKALTEFTDKLGIILNSNGSASPAQSVQALAKINEAQAISTEKNRVAADGDVSQFAELERKSLRENFGQSLPNISQFLNKEAEKLGKDNLDKSINVLSKQLEDGATGLSKKFLEILDQLDLGDSIRDSLKNTIRISQEQERIRKANLSSENFQQNRGEVFARFIASLDGAADSLRNLKSQADVLNDPLAARTVSLGSDLKEFAPNNNGLLNTLSVLGEGGSSIRSFGQALSEIESVLPSVLTTAVQNSIGQNDFDFGTEVGVLLRNNFKGRSSGDIEEIITAIGGRISSVGAGEQGLGVVLTKVKENLNGFARDLTSSFSGFRDSANQAKAKLEEGFNNYANALANIRQREIRSIDDGVKVAEIRVKEEENRIREEGLNIPVNANIANSPFVFRQQQLLRGTGAENNIDSIIDEYKKANDEVIQKTQEREAKIAQGVDPAGLLVLQKELDGSTGKLDRLSRALTNLTDITTRASSAQARLNFLNEQEKGRIGLLERFITADPQEQARISRSAELSKSVVDTLNKGGNLGRFSGEDIKDVLGLLRSAGNTNLFGGNVSGNELADRLIKALAPVAFKDINQQKDSVNSELRQIFKEGSDAQKALGQVFSNNTDRLVTNLSTQNESFLNNLKILLASQQLAGIEQQKAAINVRQAENANNQQQLDRLKGLGIKNQNNLNNVVPALPDINKLSLLESDRVKLNNSVLSNNFDFTSLNQQGALDFINNKRDSEGIRRFSAYLYEKRLSGAADILGITDTKERGKLGFSISQLSTQEFEEFEKKNPLSTTTEKIQKLNEIINKNFNNVIENTPEFKSKTSAFDSKRTEIIQRISSIIPELDINSLVPRNKNSTESLTSFESLIKSFTDGKLSFDSVKKSSEELNTQFRLLADQAKAIKDILQVGSARDLLSKNLNTAIEQREKQQQAFGTVLGTSLGTDLGPLFVQGNIALPEDENLRKQREALENYDRIIGKNNGGSIGGTDIQLAALTPGEFVMNASASARYLPLLKKMNKGQVDGFANGGTPTIKEIQERRAREEKEGREMIYERQRQEREYFGRFEVDEFGDKIRERYRALEREAEEASKLDKNSDKFYEERRRILQEATNAPNFNFGLGEPIFGQQIGNRDVNLAILDAKTRGISLNERSVQRSKDGSITYTDSEGSPFEIDKKFIQRSVTQIGGSENEEFRQNFLRGRREQLARQNKNRQVINPQERARQAGLNNQVSLLQQGAAYNQSGILDEGQKRIFSNTSQNIQRNLSEVQSRQPVGPNIDAAKINQAADKFNNGINKFESAITSLNKLPVNLVISGKQTVEVIFNGAEALTKMQPQIQEMIEQQVQERLTAFFKQNLSDLPIGTT